MIPLSVKISFTVAVLSIIPWLVFSIVFGFWGFICFATLFSIGLLYPFVRLIWEDEDAL